MTEPDDRPGSDDPEDPSELLRLIGRTVPRSPHASASPQVAPGAEGRAAPEAEGPPAAADDGATADAEFARTAGTADDVDPSADAGHGAADPAGTEPHTSEKPEPSTATPDTSADHRASRNGARDDAFVTLAAGPSNVAGPGNDARPDDAAGPENAAGPEGTDGLKAHGTEDSRAEEPGTQDEPEPENDQDPEFHELADDTELEHALEALLLVVDAPVDEAPLATALHQTPSRIRQTLHRMSLAYTADRRGIDLRRAGEGWRFYTRDRYAPYVEKMLMDGQRARLTRAALETLAVVAYRQPVTRARVSAVRGVNCDGVLRTLLTRGLVEEAGTEEHTGGTLFRTTELFLERLGISSVAELPPLAPLLPDIDAIDDLDS
ncbi:Segregation and condensation protein B [Pseudonocardia sp. Ae406_Ps2]|uniref:SMC-Scp complex subunit ScpB n=1 Tax=unclassified Pseudonocardia TaxID=2619320 RepID=UPI00095ACA68|nr:Segregation and condensation protein B [Pseudonocardia sp. Ae406_Ps2]OLM07721.1 Segregation and condensation protein B [Pseudonocardia sp. Ae331_Ps2]OLM22060.1 Segregation and condensation protein B [Pseudonocardia sp. Ae706_Ps2]